MGKEIRTIDDLKETETFTRMRRTAEDTPMMMVYKHIVLLLHKIPDFTGNLEINFKDGKLMDINETKRTKF